MSDTSPPPRRHPLLRGVEILFWIVVLIVVAERFGPQFSAWTGLGPPQGAVAPFEVKTLDAARVSSETLEGTPTVVIFWATWCTVCGWELPAIQRLHERYPDGEVTILALSIDRGGEGRVRNFLEERGFTFPVALAGADLQDSLGGVHAVPTTLVIDADGVVRHRLVGVSGPGTLQRSVARLLSPDAGPAHAD